jgi:hypothetical protein
MVEPVDGAASNPEPAGDSSRLAKGCTVPSLVAGRPGSLVLMGLELNEGFLR